MMFESTNGLLIPGGAVSLFDSGEVVTKLKLSSKKPGCRNNESGQADTFFVAYFMVMAFSHQIRIPTTHVQYSVSHFPGNLFLAT